MNQSIVRISTEAQESLQSASATEQAAEQVGSLANRLDEIVSQFQVDMPADSSRQQPA